MGTTTKKPAFCQQTAQCAIASGQQTMTDAVLPTIRSAPRGVAARLIQFPSASDGLPHHYDHPGPRWAFFSWLPVTPSGMQVNQLLEHSTQDLHRVIALRHRTTIFSTRAVPNRAAAAI